MDDNPSKGVKIDPNSVTLLKSSAIALGVSGDAWQIFLSKVSAIAPGAAGLTKDRFMIIMLLDNKTRDGRIVRASTGGKWGPGYKASLKRDVEKIIAVADAMGEDNFLNIDGYFKPLLETIPKIGAMWFNRFFTKPTNPRWEGVAHTIQTSSKVIKLGAVPAPAPAPAPSTSRGYCTEGDETSIIGLPIILSDLNRVVGHKWEDGQKVRILNIEIQSESVIATIKNEHDDTAVVPIEVLKCFATPPTPPPTEVPTPPEAPTPPEPEPTPPDEVVTAPPEEIFIPKPREDILDKINILISEIVHRFTFEDPIDAGVFFSTWFMRDGSCLLKGAPGTGKTTLLQLAAMAMSGQQWKTDPTVMSVNATEDTLLDWMKKHDIFAMAQYNADKEPEDVFFYTDISIDKREMKEIVDDKPVDKEISKYIFKPTPRPIVSSFVKLHNESNRLGPNVADALLGLLAEKRVEYKGDFFTSPDREKHPEWDGHLNFFDYNPHLDVEGMEMERALLDRIDVGIYLSAGGLNTRYRILRGTQRKDRPAKIPRAFFYDLRNPETTIIPLTPEDILYTWTITDKIPMDQEALRWIAFFTNLPNTTVRTFKQGAYWSVEKPSTPSARPTIRSKSDQFIDPTVISYKGSKSQMTIQTPATVGEAIDEFSALDAMNRPLGSRSELSLRNLLRSVVFVTHVRNRRAPLTFIVNDKTLPDDKRKKNRYKKIEMIINHLPYVLDHRVNIGVETDIQQNFLNFAHFIKYFFIPQVFWNERRHEEWLTAMDVMNDMKLVKADGTKKEDDELRTEWLQKFMAAMGETGRQDTYFAEHIQNDPFMTQLYILAGTTVE